MAPSRTEAEQAVMERPEGRGKTMDFASSSDVGSDDVSVTETKRNSKTVDAKRFDVETDESRDERLTEFGKDTLRDRYLLPGETYQDLFARVAAAYADDAAHAQRVYDYISKLWFMARPAPQRRRARQLLRNPRDGIFQGGDPRHVERRVGQLRPPAESQGGERRA